MATMLQRFAVLIVAVALCSCIGSSHPHSEVDPRYPVKHSWGKSYQLIPAEDYLARTYVVPPIAPISMGQCIVVSLSDRRAWLFRDGVPVWESVTCTGKDSHATALGQYQIVDKHKDWVSTIYNVPMPFFLRFDRDSIGIHAGAIAVLRASHGCIRVPLRHAEELFNMVEVGTPVFVQ